MCFQPQMVVTYNFTEACAKGDRDHFNGTNRGPWGAGGWRLTADEFDAYNKGDTFEFGKIPMAPPPECVA